MARHVSAAAYIERIPIDLRQRWVTKKGNFSLKQLRNDFINPSAPEVPDWLYDVIERAKPGFFDHDSLNDSHDTYRDSGDEVGDTATSLLTPIVEERTPVKQPPDIAPTRLMAETRTQLEIAQERYDLAVAKKDSTDPSKVTGAEWAAILTEENNAIEALSELVAEMPATGKTIPPPVVTATAAPTKRKFSWLIKSYMKEEDEKNQRGPDGSLKDLAKYPDFQDDKGRTYVEGSDIPDDWDEAGFLTTFEELAEINGMPGYDGEKNALGLLPKNLYMLIPDTWISEVCPLEAVCGGLGEYSPSTIATAAVYALAKAQAKDFTQDTTEQQKWAVLRMESFKAGWFDKQKYCTRVPTPSDCVKVMMKDWPEIKKFVTTAWEICSFIPYLTEFNFRTTCTAYTAVGSADYVQRANKFAASSKFEASFDFMKPEYLFGTALRWIGVKRVKDVLKSKNEHIPSVFMLRKSAAPAGSAIVTSACAVIRAIQGAGWWDPIKQKGGYRDEPIEVLALKIYDDPWKYHLLAGTYGLPILSDDDKAEVRVAKEEVMKVAPILQAYMDTVLRNSDLGRVKVLNRCAKSDPAFYQRARSMFQNIMRRRVVTLEDVFAAFAFLSATPATAPIAPANV